jgi:hypothetical protein
MVLLSAQGMDVPVEEPYGGAHVAQVIRAHDRADW